MKLDDNGWRIPRRATQAHEIYLRCLRGLNSKEIAQELSLSAHQVDVVIWRLKRAGDRQTCEARNDEHEDESRSMISERGAERSCSRVVFVNTRSAAAISELLPSR
jgi:FixJ family two-component response regulator